MGYARCNIKPLQDNTIKLPENWEMHPDIKDGKLVMFDFDYYWAGTTCHIKDIKWEAARNFPNDQTNKNYFRQSAESLPENITINDILFRDGSESQEYSGPKSVFTKSNKIIIKFGSQIILSPELGDMTSIFHIEEESTGGESGTTPITPIDPGEEPGGTGTGTDTGGTGEITDPGEEPSGAGGGNDSGEVHSETGSGISAGGGEITDPTGPIDTQGTDDPPSGTRGVSLRNNSSSFFVLNEGELSDSIGIQNVDTSYLPCSFKYSYTVRYINNEWQEVTNETDESEYSDVEYLIEIDKIKIPKTSKYEHNVVFTENGVNELLTKIKKYPVINVIGDPPITDSQPYITVYHGSDSNTEGTKIKVGSVITFPDSEDTDSTGTFRVSIDGEESIVSVKGFGSSSSGDITLGGNLMPAIDAKLSEGGNVTLPGGYNIGSNSTQWNILYTRSAVFGNDVELEQGEQANQEFDDYVNVRPYKTGIGNLGTESYHWGNLYVDNGILSNINLNGIRIGSYTTDISNNTFSSNDLKTVLSWCNGSSTNNKFLRGDGVWSDTLEGTLTLAANHRTELIIGAYGSNYGTSGQVSLWYCNNNYNGYKANTVYIGTTNNADLSANKVYNAVFNDYAECRTTIDLTPGHVVIDQDDGSLICALKRLQPGGQVISDTYGHLMGETDTAKTPIAVAGRVLVYTYQPRENYHAGMAVCSAPDGTVDIMTREEIRDYPDCIVGIVSEIPQYETWGSDNVKVDGRIWIKVK